MTDILIGSSARAGKLASRAMAMSPAKVNLRPDIGTPFARTGTAPTGGGQDYRAAGGRRELTRRQRSSLGRIVVLLIGIALVAGLGIAHHAGLIGGRARRIGRRALQAMGLVIGAGREQGQQENQISHRRHSSSTRGARNSGPSLGHP